MEGLGISLNRWVILLEAVVPRPSNYRCSLEAFENTFKPPENTFFRFSGTGRWFRVRWPSCLTWPPVAWYWPCTCLPAPCKGELLPVPPAGGVGLGLVWGWVWGWVGLGFGLCLGLGLGFGWFSIGCRKILQHFFFSNPILFSMISQVETPLLSLLASTC